MNPLNDIEYTPYISIHLFLFKYWYEATFHDKFEIPEKVYTENFDLILSELKKKVNKKYKKDIDLEKLFAKIIETNQIGFKDIENLIIEEKNIVTQPEKDELVRIANLDINEILPEYLSYFNLELSKNELKEYSILHNFFIQLYNWGFFHPAQNPEKYIAQLMFYMLYDYGERVNIDNGIGVNNFYSNSHLNVRQFLRNLKEFNIFGLFGENYTKVLSTLLYYLAKNESLVHHLDKEFVGKRKRGGKKRLLESEFIIENLYFRLESIQKKRNIKYTIKTSFNDRMVDAKVNRAQWVWNLHNQLKKIKKIEYKRSDIPFSSLIYKEYSSIIEKASKYKKRDKIDSFDYLKEKFKLAEKITINDETKRNTRLI